MLARVLPSSEFPLRAHTRRAPGTRTVDYALIMSGEIDTMLDEGEVHLKSGDVVVQQATNHAWINRGKKPCRVALILMDSQEP
jgi:uncharacterized cupin superfamily protein